MSTVYILIPTAQLTQAMINRSVNRKLENMRSNVAGTTKLVEVEEPVPSIYDGYQWYNAAEMDTILEAEEWQS